jgi:hypothetical protein
MQVFDFFYSTIHANLAAQQVTALAAAITGATDSTSPATGALTVAGGVGIGKDLYVGGVALRTIGGGTYLRPVDSAVKPLYLGWAGSNDAGYVSGVYSKQGYFYNGLYSYGGSRLQGNTYLDGYVLPRTDPYAGSLSVPYGQRITVPRGWYTMDDEDRATYGVVVALTELSSISGPASGTTKVVSMTSKVSTLYYYKY